MKDKKIEDLVLELTDEFKEMIVAAAIAQLIQNVEDLKKEVKELQKQLKAKTKDYKN